MGSAASAITHVAASHVRSEAVTMPTSVRTAAAVAATVGVAARMATTVPTSGRVAARMATMSTGNRRGGADGERHGEGKANELNSQKSSHG